MSNDNSKNLLISVSNRLFLALVILFAIALAVAALYYKTNYIVPVIVIMSGMIGGFVGLQRRLKTLTIPDLELIDNSWVYTCLAPFIGGVLALLLYVLFLSELLTGDMFPEFIKDKNSDTISGFQRIFYQEGVNYQDYAKLVFWSFVAGFSERFVTDVISRFEGAAVKSLPPGPENQVDQTKTDGKDNQADQTKTDGKDNKVNQTITDGN